KQQQAKLQLTGHYVNTIWQGLCQQFSIASPDVNNWKLTSPATLGFANNTLSIGTLCLANNTSKLCLNGHWHEAKDFSADVQAQHVPIDWLNPLLADELQLHGTLNANITFAGSENNLQNIDAKIQVEPGYFSYALNEIPERFDYHGGNIMAKLSAQTFLAKINLDLLQDAKLTANINADPKKWRTDDYLASPIQGDFNLTVPKLNFLAALIPKIDQTIGRAVANGKITGTIKQPHLTADIKGFNAGFRLGMLNVRTNDMNITGTINDLHLDYHADGKAGPGKFHLDGMTELKSNVLHTKLKLTGDNMLISNTPGVVVYATPNLSMDIKDMIMQLGGDITIPRGAFRSYDYDDTVELSEDVVYLQKDATQKPAVINPVLLTSRIELKLGDNISVDSKGLKGNLKGKLTINDVAAGATTAYGRLVVADGHYNFRGQDLLIDNASLNFNGGPISNPNVNVRAIRKVGGDASPTSAFLSTDQSRVVGIRITGTLKKYNIDLFSEPDNLASKDEILSYLLLGQSISSVSHNAGNAQMLLGAAQALNLSGGGGTVARLKSQIQQKFGLTELDVTSFERKDK
ncbi:MAG: translocation/assembly module TamB domain-containing protein, partial [Pseudomonadota bacterium]|nr:translocation/assembly module TamB domain-containing protein [Pseudomonadota bacterium]